MSITTITAKIHDTPKKWSAIKKQQNTQASTIKVSKYES
jgi:hypothetical protein